MAHQFTCAFGEMTDDALQHLGIEKSSGGESIKTGRGTQPRSLVCPAGTPCAQPENTADAILFQQPGRGPSVTAYEPYDIGKTLARAAHAHNPIFSREAYHYTAYCWREVHMLMTIQVGHCHA